VIQNVPTGKDFRDSGSSFLNLAWDNAISLALNFEDWSVHFHEGADGPEFWKRARRPLATALAMTQQGVEFLLKGRIADVSPFLLLHSGPSNWPKGSQRKSASFAEFRTMDAQDLIRAHDTVASTRLPSAFKTRNEELRLLRNSVFHTVVKESLVVAVTDVLVAILEAVHLLVGSHMWPQLRMAFIQNAPISVAAGGDLALALVNRELEKAIELLKPAQTRELLNFNKRQRRYSCPANSR